MEVVRTIGGVPSVKLVVNLVKADKIVNLIVKEEVVKTMDKTITATIRGVLPLLFL